MVNLEVQCPQIASERERYQSWRQLPLGPLDVQEYRRNPKRKTRIPTKI